MMFQSNAIVIFIYVMPCLSVEQFQLSRAARLISFYKETNQLMSHKIQTNVLFFQAKLYA